MCYIVLSCILYCAIYCVIYLIFSYVPMHVIYVISVVMLYCHTCNVSIYITDAVRHPSLREHVLSGRGFADVEVDAATTLGTAELIQ